MKNSKLLIVLSVLLTMGLLLSACASAATPTRLELQPPLLQP